MKRKIGVLLTVIVLACLLTAQATITLAPKTPAPTETVVILMFDDGWRSQYTNALPILESYGYKASFAIYPKAIDGQYPDYMSWSQIESLSKNGYDIESHTYSHLDLTNLSASTLSSELANSKLALVQHGIQAGALMYPMGLGVDNVTVKQAIKDAGYLVARGTDDGTIDLSDSTLDYYALNCYPIGITTNLPYFEAALYDVSGSNIAILLYHKIDNVDTADETVTVDNFAQQMAYLHDNNFTVKTLSDVFFDVTPLPTPTSTPSPTATPTPTTIPSPTIAPTPTPAPSTTATPQPTTNPTPKPTPTQTTSPTTTNSPIVTPSVTQTPTSAPTTPPTDKPTASPSATTHPTTAAQPTEQMSDSTALLIIVVCVLSTALTFALILKRHT